MPSPGMPSHSDRMRVLSDASKAFAESGLALDALLAEVVRTVAGCLGDTCAIRMLSPDHELVCKAHYTRDPEASVMLGEVLSKPLSSAVGESAEVMRTGRPVSFALTDPAVLAARYPRPEVATFLARFAPRAVMIAPLRVRGRIFGTVTVSSADPEVEYTGDQVELLQELADRAALAIENADLYLRLAKSEDKLNLAMESGRLGVFEWDITKGTVYWSPSLEETHGIPKGTFEGTFEAFQRDIHPDDRERVLGAIEEVVRTRSHHHLEYRIIRPDGEIRWVEAHASLYCDAAGHPLRLLGICSDVSERKRTERQLEQTMESLTEADRRKDQFLAMLAHELRNPLTPMVLALRVLESRGDLGEVERRAQMILGRQLRHMTRLVDDLLDLSRISRGKIELALEPLDLSKVVREVILDHEDAARARAIQLDMVLPNGACWVNGDAVRLAQVLGNVLGNALKFSSSGEPIRIRLARDPDGWPTLSIHDQGAGIAPEALPSVFEPFMQADTRFDRHHGGLGLGLAVVRELVELHGGRVTAHSDGVGKGTEIRMSLPPGGDIAAATTASPARTSSRPLRILIVEDNADAAEMLSFVLRSEGHQVETAGSGSDAAPMAARFRPEVILCDLGLPGKNGYEVAAELRRAPETEHVQLIAVSGYGSEDDRRRAAAAGFDLHLTKPVDPIGLLALLGELARSGVASGRG